MYNLTPNVLETNDSGFYNDEQLIRVLLLLSCMFIIIFTDYYLYTENQDRKFE